MRTIFIILAILGAVPAHARHITGGELYYEFIGNQGDNYTYRITLKLYRDANSDGAKLDEMISVGIFSQSNNPGLIKELKIGLETTKSIQLLYPGPCITNPPVVHYDVGYYIQEVTLPASDQGYVLTYQRCCRIGAIDNVLNSGSIGATFTTTIPGTTHIPDGPKNSSAIFSGKDTVAICANTYFEYDFGATDKEGDYITYQFCDSYAGASIRTPVPEPPAAPPYFTVPYAPGFSGSTPMGAQVTINPATGLVSGVAPAAGTYVLTVCASEFRNGVLINISRKDLQVKVTACLTTQAQLEPTYYLCDNSYTLTIQNLNQSYTVNSQKWNFGEANRPDSLSFDRSPSYTYSKPGVYTIKLITNPGLSCSDTGFAIVRVFPGFKPDFSFIESCAKVPIQFTNNSVSALGAINYQRWDFGDLNTNGDTSLLFQPSYAYNTAGSYNITFTVADNNGCMATLHKTMQVLLKPHLQTTNDTLICDIDDLELNAVGNGTVTWTSNFNMPHQTGATIVVSPNLPTKYFVHLETVPGCENTDTIFVNVISEVTIAAGADTTICLSDSMILSPTGDALHFSWEPVNIFNNVTLKNPIAVPLGNTEIIVTGRVGNCSTKSSLTVRAVPYPTVDAGSNQTICFDSTAQLAAQTTAAFYTWSRPATLINSHTLEPVAQPLLSTTYYITVSDILGCPKEVQDSVHVIVIPKVIAFAGNDTAIVRHQPLQLNATGGESYAWEPSITLTSTNRANPIATPETSQQYVVKVSTPEGCYSMDTMQVVVFNTAPDIFVPNAFTPNNDGNNEIVKAFPVGIAAFKYFSIYNRWGQLVFSTQNPAQGWDGRLNGHLQNNQTFIWTASGTDFEGFPVFRKGTLTLVR